MSSSLLSCNYIYFYHKYTHKIDFVQQSFKHTVTFIFTNCRHETTALEIDDKMYHQTRAIARFITKNLYGSDEFETMEIDAAVDFIKDIRQGKNISGPANAGEWLFT